MSYSEIARSFTEARLSASALPDFPGVFPDDLASGYSIQENAIARWPDVIAGWKIGRVPPELEAQLGAPRVVGPIFRQKVARPARDHVALVPVFEGGFAAVEAEFVVRLGRDAPPKKLDWTLGEAAALVAAIHMGIETAGSPLATINVLGPVAVASDFGNNNGLILGPALEGWQKTPWEDFPCETWIDGVCVGKGSAASIPGGPIEALRFLLGHLAARGRPLTAGTLVSTGAATGIHDIVAGQSSEVRFGSRGTLRCMAVPATAEPFSR